jgi:hypothetical protein
VTRAAVIEQLRATQETLNKLLALLESSQGDRFAAHIYQSRKDYRRACDIAGKSGKQIERCVISTCQVAQSLGFKGDFRQWEHLLRIHE